MGSKQSGSTEQKSIYDISVPPSDRREDYRPMREGVYRLLDIDYKICDTHGFVYFEMDGEWVKSMMTKEGLMRAMRLHS